MKAIAAGIIIALVAVLLIGLQQYRYVDLQGDLKTETKSKDDALAANKESEATITTLRAEAKRNADYQADLSKRLKDSEKKATKARKDFDDLKRTNKPVRDWANQRIPDGLRGKPAASSGKDNSGKAGTP
jgi:LysB family phage lysis regulatory protein